MLLNFFPIFFSVIWPDRMGQWGTKHDRMWPEEAQSWPVVVSEWPEQAREWSKVVLKSPEVVRKLYETVNSLVSSDRKFLGGQKMFFRCSRHFKPKSAKKKFYQIFSEIFFPDILTGPDESMGDHTWQEVAWSWQMWSVSDQKRPGSDPKWSKSDSK